MADADARIMDLMRRELEKDRGAKTEALQEMAAKIDPDVAKLTTRQFHAKYPLQVKRSLKGGGRKGARKATTRKRGGGRRAGAPKGARAVKKAAKRAPRKAAAKRPRKAANGRRRRAASAGPRGGDVRTLLLQFAKTVAKADGKAEMVDVLAGLDTWVDRVVAAAGR